jgi:hypothetical protein
MSHQNPSEYADKWVKLNESAKHHCCGSVAFVIDYWDRLNSKRSWLDSTEAVVWPYVVRQIQNKLPEDNEVLYVKVKKDDAYFGHLVHVSEIEGLTEDPRPRKVSIFKRLLGMGK